jgi:hypothetical protein
MTKVNFCKHQLTVDGNECLLTPSMSADVTTTLVLHRYKVLLPYFLFITYDPS